MSNAAVSFNGKDWINWLTVRGPTLARNIVLNVDKPSVLAAAEGLSAADWNIVKDHPYFRRLVTDLVASLKDAQLPLERARSKAQMLHDVGSMERLAEVITNPETAAGTLLDAIELNAKLAGVDVKGAPAAVPASYAPVVQIVLSQDGQARIKTYVQDAASIAAPEPTP